MEIASLLGVAKNIWKNQLSNLVRDVVVGKAIGENYNRGMSIWEKGNEVQTAHVATLMPKVKFRRFKAFTNDRGTYYVGFSPMLPKIAGSSVRAQHNAYGFSFPEGS